MDDGTHQEMGLGVQDIPKGAAGLNTGFHSPREVTQVAHFIMTEYRSLTNGTDLVIDGGNLRNK